MLGESSKAVHRSISRLLRAALSRMPFFHTLRLNIFRAFFLNRRASKIVKAAGDAGAHRLWLTASSIEMIWIAEKLTAKGVDVRLTIWDSPEYLSHNLRLRSRLRHSVLQSFANSLHQARSISVIGTAMQADFRARYGVESEIIRHGIDERIAPVHFRKEKKSEIRIVFAGSLYSKDEWNSLIKALEGVDWKIADRPIVLHFIGRFPLTNALKPKNLILHGEKTFGKTLELLSTMDIGYLPYWFSKDHEIVARTSFPGKLSAYAVANLAIFHHAPSYTEATTFLEANPFGLACDSLDSSEIIDALTRLVEFAETDICRVSRSNAVRLELSQNAMASRFRRFVGEL